MACLYTVFCPRKAKEFFARFSDVQEYISKAIDVEQFDALCEGLAETEQQVKDKAEFWRWNGHLDTFRSQAAKGAEHDVNCIEALLFLNDPQAKAPPFMRPLRDWARDEGRSFAKWLTVSNGCPARQTANAHVCWSLSRLAP